MSNLIVWEYGAVAGTWNGGRAAPLRNISATIKGDGSTVCLFDVRVMNKAVTESGGKATESDLGVISYAFNDMADNDGDITLPFG